MKNQFKNIVVAIYYHPEAYPPTLNAVGELSRDFDNIYLLYQPHLQDSWVYPRNVHLIRQKKQISVKEQAELNVLSKALMFLSFTFAFLKICLKVRPVLILVYDPFPLLSYHYTRIFLGFKHKIWYHNHDVIDSVQKKYSIGWWAAKTEKKSFKYLDIFSLPSNERLQYFPLDKFKGKYFYVPNYPLKSFYDKFYESPRLSKNIKIIFQGHISPFHGIEEIISILDQNIEGYNLELLLKGPCKEEYKILYEELAKKNNVKHRLFFFGVTSYAEVPVITSKCNIGIGIHAKNDIMNNTLGTASNKLYEYAALGLPILYYDSENFKKHLKNYKWAVGTDLNTITITEAIKLIIRDYDHLSFIAHKDFSENLNFEKFFESVRAYLKDGSNLN